MEPLPLVKADPVASVSEQTETLVLFTQSLSHLDSTLRAERDETAAALAKLVKELEVSQKTLADKLLQQQQRIAQLESEQRVSNNLRIKEQKQNLELMKTLKLDSIKASCGKSHLSAQSDYRMALRVIKGLNTPVACLKSNRSSPYPDSHFMHRFFRGRKSYLAYTHYTYLVLGREHLPYFENVRDENWKILEQYRIAKES